MLKKIFILIVCVAFVGSVNAQTDKGGNDKGATTSSGETDKTGAATSGQGVSGVSTFRGGDQGVDDTDMDAMPALDTDGAKDPSQNIAEMDLEDLQNIQIPAKWKDESAVILSRTTEYSYRVTSDGSGYYYREYLEVSKKTKERILLADQSVVDEYSELLYDDDESVDVRIVKKDGTVVRSAQRHVVKKEIQVPFENGYGREEFVSVVYNKMAVPNLQVGDIIEVVILSESEFRWTTRISIDLRAQYIPLQSEYPIMEQSFEVNVRGVILMFASNNGAPKMKKDGEKYVLKTKSMDPYEGEMFDSYYRDSPYLKFTVYQRTSEGTKRFFGGAFRDENDDDFRPSPDDVRSVAWHRVTAYDPLYIADEARDYVRKYGRNADEETKAKMAYYYLKHITLLNPAGWRKKAEEEHLEPVEMSNEQFILALGRAFEFLDIPCDLVVVTSRSLVSLDDMVMESEMQYMLRTGTFDNPTYYYHFAELSDLQQLPTVYEGQDVYVFPFSSTELIETGTVQTEKIPFSTYDDNIRTVAQEIALNLDELEINTVRKTSSAGHFKMGAVKRFLSRQDVARADSELHKTKFFGNSLRPSAASKKKFGHWQRKNRWTYEEWLEIRNEYAASALEFDNNVYNYEVDILNMGWNNDSAFQCVENYTSDGMLMNAGNNYILYAGKLIDSQIEVGEDEHTRDAGRDIFVNYAKTYDNEVRIEIPAGYKAENIGALNYNVDNATGSFVSSAKMEGNTLVIKTKKIYKKSQLKSSEWSEMTKFLDAAYDFTKQKILLKKL